MDLWQVEVKAKLKVDIKKAISNTQKAKQVEDEVTFCYNPNADHPDYTFYSRYVFLTV